MPHSFFHLAPDNDSRPEPRLGSETFCVRNGCADLPDAEHEALLVHADALHDAFYAALNAHSATHPGITYDVIFHALDCLAYCLRRQMLADTADA